MTLYRVFPWAPRRLVRPLDVPRERQGANRHDNPDRYTALYLAREAESAVAEAIQAFRGRTLADADLERSTVAVSPWPSSTTRPCRRSSTSTTQRCWSPGRGARHRSRHATARPPRPWRGVVRRRSGRLHVVVGAGGVMDQRDLVRRPGRAAGARRTGRTVDGDASEPHRRRGPSRGQAGGDPPGVPALADATISRMNRGSAKLARWTSGV